MISGWWSLRLKSVPQGTRRSRTSEVPSSNRHPVIPCRQRVLYCSLVSSIGRLPAGIKPKQSAFKRRREPPIVSNPSTTFLNLKRPSPTTDAISSFESGCNYPHHLKPGRARPSTAKYPDKYPVTSACPSPHWYKTRMLTTLGLVLVWTAFTTIRTTWNHSWI